MQNAPQGILQFVGTNDFVEREREGKREIGQEKCSWFSENVIFVKKTTFHYVPLLPYYPQLVDWKGGFTKRTKIV